MIYFKQLKSVLIHKWYVLVAGLRLGGIPLWRLLIHDWSKFTPVEFVNYSRFKFSAKCWPVAGWARAWLHHMHHNPHHPEYWVLSWRGDPAFYDGLGKNVAEFVTILPMPEIYVREMTADMMATGRAVTGSWDMALWVNKEGPRMLLHEDTITKFNICMIHAGYTRTTNEDWSWTWNPDEFYIGGL